MQEVKEFIPTIHDYVSNIQDYFISKILNLDFVVTNISEYTLSIEIDGKYQFELWIANPNIETSIRPRHGISGEYFMFLEFTEEQSIELYHKIFPVIKEAKEKFLIPEKLILYNKLKEELGLYMV